MAEPEKPQAAPRSRGRPRLAEAEAINDLVRRAAFEELIERGEASTMIGIACRAGVSRKALYARYANKEELFVDSIRSLLLDVQPPPPTPGQWFAERLRNYIIGMHERLSKPHSRAISRLMALDPYYVGSLRQDIRKAQKMIFHAPLMEIVVTAQKAGEVAVEHPEDVVQMLMRIIFTPMFPGQEDRRWHSPLLPADQATLLADIISNGLLIKR